MVPIDQRTGNILAGKLAGYVAGRSSRIHPSHSMTESWSGNVTDVLARLQNKTLSLERYIYMYQNYLNAIHAAGVGGVSIMPDFLGYGESFNYNRSFFVQQPYRQAIALSWLAAKGQVPILSNGCSMLQDSATLSGTFWQSRLVQASSA